MSYLESSEIKFLSDHGVSIDGSERVPVIECFDSGYTYVKFMSDGGISDDRQGDQFRTWLKDNEFEFESNRSRSFKVKNL